MPLGMPCGQLLGIVDGIGGRFEGIGMFEGKGNGGVGVGDAPPSP
jgi:hypothetical protein